ncbi:MAG TPA: 1-deoxy-D-xylulose-5-phosphate synthase [Firmicutes bacterium]|nr:1-deoxy-D-xylulose-5-phosphate synthase [Bacillota bacterium]
MSGDSYETGSVLDALGAGAHLKLRSMNNRELAQLAGELRSIIIETTASTGGHLAPNLGVVELTIALHAVLESPRDKIIWDVGHQCYAHKILTGRGDRFSTLRQYGGISGFPRRDESIHDIFNTGHSSTSISAALGIAIARDLRGEDFTVAAVIGDGSMTGGMAFEALNHAGHVGTDLIVVLNDNEMSISRNVGALASYLSRLRMNPGVRRVKGKLEEFVERVPLMGDDLSTLVKRVKGSVKYLVVPGMLFEELGFTYLGPIDGHDIATIRRTVEDACDRGGPVLIHVVTQKGKGYGPAERNPRAFHGVGPFDIATGAQRSGVQVKTQTYTDVFEEALVELGACNDRVVAITAAMPDGTGLEKFARRFPGRFFDVGIAEQHAVTFAAGLAVQGFVPVVAIYSTFLQRAYDQILHDVCLQKLHVIFAIDRAGLVGEDGPTHHGVFDMAFLRHMPNMSLMAPADGDELVSMLRFAVACDGPVALRYPRSGLPAERYSQTTTAGVLEPLNTPDTRRSGRAHVIKPGNDLAIFAVGSMVGPSVEASKFLDSHGINAAVVNARFVKPLDVETLTGIATRTGQVLTVEEGVLQGGFGSAVLEALNDAGAAGVRVMRLGVPDRFIEHGARDILLEKCGLTASAIARAARQLTEGRGRVAAHWR